MSFNVYFLVWPLFIVFIFANVHSSQSSISTDQSEKVESTLKEHIHRIWRHLLHQDKVFAFNDNRNRSSNYFNSFSVVKSDQNKNRTTAENVLESLNSDQFYIPETLKHHLDKVNKTLQNPIEPLGDHHLQQPADSGISTSLDSQCNSCSSFLYRIHSSLIKEVKQVSLQQYLLQKQSQTIISDNLNFKNVSTSNASFPSHYYPELPYVKPNLTRLGEANVQMLKRLFASDSLNSIRNHEHNQPLKERALRSITDQLSSYALEIYNQEFVTKAQNGSELKGVNVIGVIPGKQRNQPGDRILLIGAHYDTVKNSVGVDDNGSGVAALIELARICSSHIGQFNSTIFFVAFDMQEQGILGSLAFVNQYLIPEELSAKKSKFVGAYVMDMVMNFDSRPRSQTLPLDITTAVPDASSWVRLNGYKGDFLSVWSRRIIDWHLWKSFYISWNEVDNATGSVTDIKLMPLDPPIPRTPLLISNWRYRTFMRSDHAAFWHHKNRAYTQSLNAVLLTDMGPWRGKQIICYHDFCDDSEFLSPANLMFLKRIVDSLARTVALLGELY